ncbi:MAG: hypothetical protein H6744_03680 [Deltaproteobacteria bacterium]|nr:hypothetical protein [Deltaproteobacteria bacterium]MCB9785777.1 hypothetical protein [Deltaproteobacteria bacterium]
MHRSRPPLLVCAVALLLGACNQGSGFVGGARLELSSCDELEEPRVFEPFELPLTFLGLQRQQDRVLLRFSPNHRLVSAADQLVITLPHVDDVQQAIRADGEAVLPLGDPDGAALGVSLHETCDWFIEALTATTGEVRFTHLGTTKGDPVTGSVTFDLVDMRSGRVAGTGFSGTFDFDVIVGIPAQLFSDPAALSGH